MQLRHRERKVTGQRYQACTLLSFTVTYGLCSTVPTFSHARQRVSRVGIWDSPDFTRQLPGWVER